MSRVQIVAELGANAFPYTRYRLGAMIHHARQAGADAVKVQLFKPRHFPIEERSEKTKYQFPRREFSFFVELAHAYHLEAGASVFDREAVELCAETKADFVKLATREEANRPLRIQCQDMFHGSVLRSVRWPHNQTVKSWPRETTLGCIPEYPARRRTWGQLCALGKLFS